MSDNLCPSCGHVHDGSPGAFCLGCWGSLRADGRGSSVVKIHVCYYCHRLTKMAPYVDGKDGSHYPACCIRDACIDRWGPIRMRCVACGRTRKAKRMVREGRRWRTRFEVGCTDYFEAGWRCEAHDPVERET